MKIEIWSDVLCPFCYIGKRNFEKALSEFEHAGDVDVNWKSFQLDPETKTFTGKNIHEYLAEKKGGTVEWAKEMNDRVTRMAREAGLKYDMDRAIPANSFDAHRLTHLAASRGLQAKMEERLFAAYFTEGKNIGDHPTLVGLGKEIGLDPADIQTMLSRSDFADEVRADIEEASSLGIRGVPFFVMDRKYGVSGAQPSEAFLETLRETWQKR
ncbi:MAG: DsbA family oxidoreductase [Spirochaetia bacterium]|nr:DsbA family oxidoreductase [Spirochaetia bacterium]